MIFPRDWVPWLIIGGPILFLLLLSTYDTAAAISTRAASGLALGVGLCLLFLAALIYIAGNWFRVRRDLFDREHFVILTIIALCFAAVFGALNYLVFLNDRSSFFVEPRLHMSLTSASKMLVEHQRRREQAIVDACLALAPRVERLPSIPVGKPIEGGRPFLTGIEDTDMIHRSEYSNRAPGPFHSLAVRQGLVHFQVLIGPSPTPLELADALRKRAESERRETARVLAQAEHIGPSLGHFMLQWAMDVIQANPNYVVPVKPLSQLLALMYALMKFLFFGVFVSLVTSSLAAKLKRSPNPSRKDDG